ncbi:MAG: MBL fold metallo-hydrolase [Pseudomonadota bacterium]|nr:MBL fold metallo-hydrolase [Pseudomonadota bacterium]
MTSISIKSQPIHHPWDGPPEAGGMIEVAPGVHWLRMPLPISLDHINLWLIEDGDKWVVVDTGFGTDQTCDLWRQTFDGPAKDRRPGRLICTHHHPDHFGQAGWLNRTYGIPCLMTEKEWLVGTLLAMLSNDTFANGQDSFYIRHGVPDDVRGRLHAVGNEYRNCVHEPPHAFTRIRDGEELTIGGRVWRVMALEGHSENLAALYCPDLHVLIAGDQVLPKISPNISVHWFKDGSEPLSDFLNSLERIAETLPEDTLVLPSHKLPFVGLHRRIADLQAHHRDRLSDLIEALEDGVPRDAWQLMPAIFPRAIGDDHVMFALGESVAHLDHLAALGRIRKESADGKVLYRRLAE